MASTIRLAKREDAEQIARIYAPFVENTPVSFESVPPDAHETANRISNILEKYPWLTCDVDGVVAGYAYASQHRARTHYQWSVDFSVYVNEEFRRRNVARAMYSTLLNIVPMQGYISAFAGITLPNAASVGFHEEMGFVPVGIYKNVGHKLGSWHDVGWWQRSLGTPPENPTTPISLSEIADSPMWQESLTKGAALLRI